MRDCLFDIETSIEELVEIERNCGAYIFYSNGLFTDELVTLIYDISVDVSTKLISFNRFEYYPERRGVSRFERVRNVKTDAIMFHKIISNNYSCGWKKLDGYDDRDIINSFRVNLVKSNLEKYGRFIINGYIKSLIEKSSEDLDVIGDNFTCRMLDTNFLFKMNEKELGKHFILDAKRFNDGRLKELDIYFNLKLKEDDEELGSSLNRFKGINYQRICFSYDGYKCLGINYNVHGILVDNLYSTFPKYENEFIPFSKHANLRYILSEKLSVGKIIDCKKLREFAKAEFEK